MSEPMTKEQIAEVRKAATSWRQSGFAVGDIGQMLANCLDEIIRLQEEMAAWQSLDGINWYERAKKAEAEIDRMQAHEPTWAELMEIIDKRYPPEVFGKGSDDNTGPRIVALCREVDRLQAEMQLGYKVKNAALSTTARERDAAEEKAESLQAEVKGLRAEVAFWLCEGQQERPEVIELNSLVKLSSLNETQTARIRELCEMFRLEHEDQPVLLAKIKSLQAVVDELRKAIQYNFCLNPDTSDGTQLIGMELKPMPDNVRLTIIAECMRAEAAARAAEAEGR